MALPRFGEVVDLDTERDRRGFSASDSFKADRAGADGVAVVKVLSLAIDDKVALPSLEGGDVEGFEGMLNKSMTIFRLRRFS